MSIQRPVDRWPRAQGLSPASIHRIWEAHGLQPHRVRTFKLSTDPAFVEKLMDVVGLYVNPRTKPSCFASTRRAKSKPCNDRSPACR